MRRKNSFPPYQLSARAEQTLDQPIGYFLQQAIENPNLINLAAGLVDSSTLPATEVSNVLAELLGRAATAQAGLQYGASQGLGSLREKVLARSLALDSVAPGEVSLGVEDVVITTGSQQLLYLVSELLLDPGDIVITEAPSYFAYQGTLSSFGARVLPVPVDDEGMNTDALAELLAGLKRTGELDRVRLIYVCDYFQNPTGWSLSLPRRQHLLELAQRFSRKQRIFILEDAAYRELRYEGDDLPTIKSFDATNSFVILAMTFSKTLAPGLKTGYGLLPRGLMASLLRFKGNHDFGSNNLCQHLLDRLVDSGAYDRHVAELRRVYRGKRDAMLAALTAEFQAPSPLELASARAQERASAAAPGACPRSGALALARSRADNGICWTRPEGGLFVWLTFLSEVATGPGSRLMQTALAEGVLYVPGQFCHVNAQNRSRPTNEARLSFGAVPSNQIREGIRRLVRAAQASIGSEVSIGAA